MAKFFLSAFADEAGVSLGEQIAAMRENGIRFFEPRNIDGTGILDLTEEELLRIRGRLDEAGIRTGSVGSMIGKAPISCDFERYRTDDFARALRAAKILGADKIRVFSFFMKPEELDAHRGEVIRRLTVMTEEAAQAGVTLCHENEAKIYGEEPERVADLLRAVPLLAGICDPANYCMSGADPVAGLEATFVRFSYMHIKDAVYRTQELLPAGEGEGQIAQLLDVVNERISGEVMLTVEPHLAAFLAYSGIDDRPMRGRYTFENSRAAFDFAVASLKKLLAENGYQENGKGYYVK